MTKPEYRGCSEVITHYINYLEEELLVDTSKLHWVLKDKTKYKQAIKKLQQVLSRVGVLPPHANCRKTCNVKYCLNPFHYEVVWKDSWVDIPDERKVEIEELSMLIDINRLQTMGFRAYLEDFNEDNPLPADKRDFFMACNRRLLDLKLPTISELELGNKKWKKR